MNAKILGHRIITLLALYNFKRQALADYLEISYNTLTKKLKGQRLFNIVELFKIKDFFNLDDNLCANIFFNANFNYLTNSIQKTES